MHTKKFFLPLIASLMALSPLAKLHAADTVFSKDGTKVYHLEYGDVPTLTVFDLSKKTITHLSLKKWLGTHPNNTEDNGFIILPSINGISRDNKGRILCAMDDALWAYDPVKNSCTKICDAPKRLVFTDVAVNPKTDDVLLTTGIRKGHEKEADAIGAKWIGPPAMKRAAACPDLFLKHGSTKPVSLLNRRAQDWLSPVFGNDGNLYFVQYDDVWVGKIDSDSDFPEFGCVLNAYRLAPLALFETDGYTPHQIGAVSVAVGKRKLYVSLYRIGGSGMGALFSLDRLSYKGDELKYPDQLAVYCAALNSTKVISDDAIHYLCASSNGAQVFYATQGKELTYWLIRNGGKPKKIALSEKKSNPARTR